MCHHLLSNTKNIPRIHSIGLNVSVIQYLALKFVSNNFDFDGLWDTPFDHSRARRDRPPCLGQELLQPGSPTPAPTRASGRALPTIGGRLLSLSHVSISIPSPRIRVN